MKISDINILRKQIWSLKPNEFQLSEIENKDSNELIESIENAIKTNKKLILSEIRELSNGKINTLEEYLLYIRNNESILPNFKMIIYVIENEILNNIKDQLKNI